MKCGLLHGAFDKKVSELSLNESFSRCYGKEFQSIGGTDPGTSCARYVVTEHHVIWYNVYILVASLTFHHPRVFRLFTTHLFR